MAIATLSLCYNNHAVFTRVVKMRRGEVAKARAAGGAGEGAGCRRQRRAYCAVHAARLAPRLQGPVLRVGPTCTA